MNVPTIFRRKKKKEVNPFTQDVEKEETRKVDENSFTFFIHSTLGSMSQKFVSVFHIPKQKYKMNWLLRIKRVIAGTLFAIYALSSLATFPNPLIILSLLTAFICLDYLWKTRRTKWVVS